MLIYFRIANILHKYTAWKYDTNIQHDYVPLHSPPIVLAIGWLFRTCRSDNIKCHIFAIDTQFLRQSHFHGQYIGVNTLSQWRVKRCEVSTIHICGNLLHLQHVSRRSGLQCGETLWRIIPNKIQLEGNFATACFSFSWLICQRNKFTYRFANGYYTAFCGQLCRSSPKRLVFDVAISSKSILAQYQCQWNWQKPSAQEIYMGATGVHVI